MSFKTHTFFLFNTKFTNLHAALFQRSSTHDMQRNTTRYYGFKGVMMLKITLFCVFGVMQCFTWFKVQKSHYFPHTVHYCCFSLLRLSETCRFLQSSSFWKARCALIGQLSGALWLAEYLCCSPYHIWEHTASPRQQYYSENKSYAFFLCVNIWVELCKSSHTVT